jgi:hypothetical protein
MIHLQDFHVCLKSEKVSVHGRMIASRKLRLFCKRTLGDLEVAIMFVDERLERRTPVRFYSKNAMPEVAALYCLILQARKYIERHHSSSFC